MKRCPFLVAGLSMQTVEPRPGVIPITPRSEVTHSGVDVILGPEMRSTGEVMGIDNDAAGGFFRAQVAVGMALPQGGKVFFSVCDRDKEAALPIATPPRP